MTPRIALIVRSGREGVARLPRALRAAGLHVTLFARPGTFAAATSHRDEFFDATPPRKALQRPPAVLRFLRQLNRSRSSRILAGDEDSLVYLSRVRAAVRRLPLGWLHEHAARAIEAGLPACASVRSLLSREAVSVIADRCGIATTPWAACDDGAGIEALRSEHGFPLVVKRDATSAGTGVTVCTTPAGLDAALNVVDAGGIVQRFVPGRPAMQAAVALDGRLLGTCGWLKEQCFPEPYGPSSIVARFDERSMREAAARYAAATGFNGFFSLDFIVGDDAPRLIEINPRPTPVCHLGGLAEALARALDSLPAQPQADTPARLAIFPQELRRNPGSAHDGTLVHDIPHDDPPLLRALCDAFLNGRQPDVKRSLAW